MIEVFEVGSELTTRFGDNWVSNAIINIDKVKKEVEISLKAEYIENLTKGRTYKGEAYPPFIKNIIEKGGLAEYVKSGGMK